MKSRNKRTAIVIAMLTLLVTLVTGLASACKKSGKSKPEDGAYICYDLTTESVLTLKNGKYVFVEGTEQSNGKYELTSATITLQDAATGEKRVGVYEETRIRFTEEEVSTTYYKAIEYAVTYDSAGGTAVEAETLLNGTTVKNAPGQPTRSGYTFVGWYKDAGHKTPYYFGVEKITDDTTLYAYWVKASTSTAEYNIDFDLNYSGSGTAVGTETIGGKLYNAQLPSVSRNGYDFKGWWISDSDDSKKLTKSYTDGMEISADTTLVAEWESTAESNKLKTPYASVESGAIKWNAVQGASSYKVEIVDPNGDSTSVKTGSTSYNFNFSAKDAGEYIVRVTAVASDASRNSDVSERYYSNKGLTRVSVSKMSVEGTVLHFEGVKDATEYFVTIKCGDEYHKHTLKSIGNEQSYDFSNCEMGENGIEFRVTASADGHASSTSRTFVYKKVLDKVSGIKVDETTGKVTWNTVSGAEGYEVRVKCGTAGHADEVAYVTSPEYCVKACEGVDGVVEIAVSAQGSGYGTSPATNYTYTRKTLATPSGVKLKGTVLSWTAVQGASKYEVTIGGKTFTCDTASKDLGSEIQWNGETEYAVKIRAIADNNASVWTDDIDARYLKLASTVKYENGKVVWTHVAGAEKYEVRVNEGEATEIADGNNEANVALTKSGENKLEVRFTAGGTTSEWASVTVTAYEVKFDTQVRGTTRETEYKVVGDRTNFDGDGLNKVGYSFVAWYYAKEGGAGSAKKYTSEFFADGKDVTLYAYYTPNTYKATYDYQDGTANGAETELNVEYDGSFEMPVPAATDETKGFSGWYTLPNGYGEQLTDETGKCLKNWTISENTTVYAFYIDQILEYTLTKLTGYSGSVYSVKKGSKIGMVKQVTVPETYKGLPVKIILGSAFANCSNLIKINIPNTIERIDTDPSAFEGCSNLQGIDVYEAREEGTLRYWSQDGVLFDNGSATAATKKVSISWIPKSLTSYEIPDGVQAISSYIFESSSLTSITIPTSVETIERDAFYSSSSLTKIIFKDSFATGNDIPGLTIAKSAFRSCTALEEITLPARLTSIELCRYALSDYSKTIPAFKSVSTTYTSDGVTDAFVSCTKFQSINVDPNCEAYSSKDGVLMNKEGTELIYVPRYRTGTLEVQSGVQTIGKGALLYCSSLTEVTLPNTVETVEECAFYYCTAMKKLVFKGNGFNDLTFGFYSFRSCTSLKELTFEGTRRNLTEIGEGAFYGCTGMRSFTVPSSVTKISDQAFRSCSYLKKVEFEDNAASDASLEFGEYVFYSTAISELKFPVQLKDLGGVLAGVSVKNIYVSADNKYYTEEDGVFFNKDKTELVFYPSGKQAEEYVIPETVKIIGVSVFANNKNLKKITIGANVETIGNEAFNSVTSLESISFTDSSVPLTIGDRAFYACSSVTSVVLPARTVSLGGYCFAYMTKLASLKLNEGLEEIPSYMVYQSTSLTSLEIPSSVKTVGYYGLAYASKLKEIKFLKDSEGKTSVTEFAQYSFYYNNALEEIEIPASVETIGYYAFYSSSTSTSLKKVTFAENSSLKKIMPYAFSYAKKLKNIEIPKSVVDIYPYAFYQSGLQEVTFEKGGTEKLYVGRAVEYMASPSSTAKTYNYGYAFSYCRSLKTVHFPARLYELGRYTFYYCDLLEKVTFTELEGSSKLANIGDYSFYNLTNLTEIVLPNSLENRGTYNFNPNYPSTSSTTAYLYWANCRAIGAYAFRGCTSLRSVTFEEGGSGEISVGDYAFYGCKLLEKIDFPARLVSFKGWDNTYEPFGGTHTFAGCSGLKEINVTGTAIAKNEYTSEDGIVYSADKKEIVLCPIAREKDVVVKNTVEKIGSDAFANCSKLTKVEFEKASGDQKLEIGERAFAGCSALTSLEIAEHVSSIADYAFEDCTALANVKLPKSLASINVVAFSGCTALAFVIEDGGKLKVEDGVLYSADKKVLYYYSPAKTEKTFVVPSTVEQIYPSAFYRNGVLETVEISQGVKYIGEEAFYECSALKKVTIGNTVQQIGDFAFYNCSRLEEVIFEEGGTNALEIGSFSDYLGKTDTGKSNYYGRVFAFDYALEEVVLPARTKMIADGTFYSCMGLQKMVIPANVTQLGTYVFYNCERLESVTFEKDTTIDSIPAYTFYQCYSLKEFSVPASVESFGDRWYNGKVQAATSYAFYYCKSLEKVTFAENCPITVIPKYLFGYCESLKEIEIPANVKEMKASSSSAAPFYRCSSLEKVTFAGENITSFENYLFAYCTGLKEVQIPSSVSKLGNYTFYYCFSLEKVTIPDTVLKLGTYTFYYCLSLSEVTLPQNLTAIPDYTFYYCRSLKDVELPASISSIGKYAFCRAGIVDFELPVALKEVPDYLFYYASDLKTIKLHDQVTSIGKYSFYNCVSLEEIDIPNSVSDIGNCAFYGAKSLTNVKLPKNAGYTIITVSTFNGAESLTEIEIPANVEKIEQYAFSSTGLTKIVIPETVTDITSHTFMGCDKLVSVTLPNSMVSIPTYIFADCSALTTVNFSQDVSEIGNYAFSNCSGLTEFNFPENLITIGSNAFNGTSITKVSLGEELRSLGALAFGGCKIEKIELAEGNESFKLENGLLYSADGESLLLASLEKSFEEFVVSANLSVARGVFENLKAKKVIFAEGVTTIPNYCLESAQYVEEVVLPSGLEEIGQYAFYESSVKEVCIPNTVTTMGSYAFSYSSVEKVTFEAVAEGTDALALILNSYTFRGCKNLTGITIPYRVRTTTTTAPMSYTFLDCVNLEEVLFEKEPETSTLEGLLSFEYSTFKNTAIKTICFPKTVSNLSSGVLAFAGNTFEDCTELENVTFESGNENQVGFGYKIFAGCTKLKNFVIPDNAERLGYQMFEGSAIEEVTIPESVTVYSNTSLTQYFDPENSVGSLKSYSVSYAFKDCLNLKKVTIYSNAIIGAYMFYNCPALEVVDIRATEFKGIYDYAFIGCTAIKELTLPASTASIAEGAFYGWTSEQKIVVNRSKRQSYAWNAFWNKGCDANIVYEA